VISVIIQSVSVVAIFVLKFSREVIATMNKLLGFSNITFLR